MPCRLPCLIFQDPRATHTNQVLANLLLDLLFFITFLTIQYKIVESIQWTYKLTLKMGRGNEQKPLILCSDALYQTVINTVISVQNFSNATSPKQWYLQISMQDVCRSLESTLIISHFQLTFWTDSLNTFEISRHLYMKDCLEYRVIWIS